MHNFLMASLSSIDVPVTHCQASKLVTYLQAVREHTQKVNLTTIIEPEEMVIKHVCDALSLMRFEELNRACNVLDVGTGAGFPGVPLAIMLPKTKFVLLDAVRKRLDFIKSMCQKLNIGNVVTQHARAEDFVKEKGQREGFDVVVARAVAELPVLSEFCLPFVKVDGIFLAMKGPTAQDEVKHGGYAICTLGAFVRDIVDVVLPRGYRRSIVVISKNRPTPRLYPRKAGTPKKRPLIDR